MSETMKILKSSSLRIVKSQRSQPHTSGVALCPVILPKICSSSRKCLLRARAITAWLTHPSLPFACSKAKGTSLIAERTPVRNGLDNFHYKQNLYLDFWTPRCLDFSQLPMVLRCGNLLDCHLKQGISLKPCLQQRIYQKWTLDEVQPQNCSYQC